MLPTGILNEVLKAMTATKQRHVVFVDICRGKSYYSRL